MTSYSTVEAATDIALAGAAVALIAGGAYVLVRSRRGRTIRVFGRTVDRPRLWASAAVCVGLSVLPGLGNLAGITPVSWQDPSRKISAVLFVVGLGLLLLHTFNQVGADRCGGSDPQDRP